MARNLDPVIDKIITARVGLLLRQPFFGNLATRLIIKENNEWCKTAATDGRHIWFNREFFAKMPIKEIEFVVAHEVLHNAFQHMSRREHRDAKIYNIAADYCVNGQLVRDGIGKMPEEPKCFHNPDYYGMSSEEIYEKLLEDAKTIDLSQLGDLLDEHCDWTKEDPNNPDRPVLTKEEMDKIRDEVKSAVIQAAQASAGKVPASIARLIKDLTEPQLNWKELLQQQIQSLIKNDYTFMRPNRKSQHLSAILPGSNYDNTIDICISIDMSGSITNEQATFFLSEIKGIMSQYRDFKIKVFCFDTQVYNEQDFDEFNMDEFDSYEPVGGGGTDFDAFWNYMAERDYVPNKLVCLTDGLPFSSWGPDNYCDTLWVMHGTTTIVPPFGEYAYFDETV